MAIGRTILKLLERFVLSLPLITDQMPPEAIVWFFDHKERVAPSLPR